MPKPKRIQGTGVVSFLVEQLPPDMTRLIVIECRSTINASFSEHHYSVIEFWDPGRMFPYRRSAIFIGVRLKRSNFLLFCYLLLLLQYMDQLICFCIHHFLTFLNILFLLTPNDEGGIG